MIDAPGFYPGMSAEDYHRDPCPSPSLAAHDVQTLLDLSPRHAWTNAPRLNPMAEPFEASADMNFGAAAHDLLAGQGEGRIVWIEEADWRKNAAKDARDQAIRDCKIPLLAGQRARLYAMRDAVIEQAAGYPELRGILEAEGACEVAMFARDRGVWLRALADWLPKNPLVPSLDWKFTKRDASPAAYERAVQEDYALRLHHYGRVRQLVAGTPEPSPAFLAVVEVEEPFGLVLHGCAEDLAEYAAKRWEEGFQTWWRCLAAGTDKKHWPLYPPGVNWVNAAPWQITRWEVEIEDMKSRRAGMTVAQGHALASRLGGPLR